MAPTRQFKDTVAVRAQRDHRFHVKALQKKTRVRLRVAAKAG